MLFTHCPDMNKYESLGKREFYVGSKYFFQDPRQVRFVFLSDKTNKIK